MQRIARSVVPRVNRTGSVDAESVEQAVPSVEQSSPAVRRRRAGRRVVRDTGAAGAAVELKVEEHPAPRSSIDTLFEEPVLKPVRESRVENDHDSHDQDKDAPQPRRTRRRATRSRRDEEAKDTFREPRRRSRSRAEEAEERNAESEGDSAEERVMDAVETLPQGHRMHHAAKPMTSLLFQEPVLPTIRPDDDMQDDDSNGDDEEEERPSRRVRQRKNRKDAADEGEGETSPRSKRRRNEDRDNDADEQESSRSSRRSRRLNAQERRAAAEVEQIEEDLEFDDIEYSPVDDERDSHNEEDAQSSEEGGSTRTRRRRRSRSNREDSSESQDTENTERHHREQEDEDDDTTVTRRRRRRRSRGGDDAQEEQPLTRRSRKQQYIDEITDVEGSTRLEAKKQRRRDNRRERSRQSQLMEQDFLARREHVERLMVVRERGRHTQISVIEDNILVEHYVSDIQEVATVGNVYLGRVQNVLPSMEAAFVDIGQPRNGVLYAGEVNWDAARLEGQPRRIELAFKSGDPVLVQVTKDPIGHKGARLTSQVTLAGRFLVLVPSGGMTGVSRKLSDRERSRLKSIVSKIAPKDMGVIIRTAADGASEEAITKDLEALMRQWEKINARREEFLHGKRPKLLQGEPDVAIRVVRDIFNDDFSKMIVEGDKVFERIEEYLDSMAPDLRSKLEKWDPAEHQGKDVFDKWQIDGQLRKGMERQVYLPSGGSIVIDRTEAMTTIDVNTGRFIGKGKSLEETVTRCNLEASEEIARQLRLRDIGGMVMIDYVDMVMPANRDLVLRRLVECLARDRTKHQVAEVTSLGLVQMTRKRIGQGLVEAFSEECSVCKGRGFIVHDEPTVSAEYADPYALKGGDPFVKTNKRAHNAPEIQAPQGSSPDVKAKLAQIAAAAIAAGNETE
ncbi:Rne/Rng family ribonuclease [Bifidobacterium tsurumiense]|uniref:Rne/Rng family ribonuclease n=1 Tax=Bifidobacterium tsurumiense TaxID=356829 RepID=UPI0012B219CF|nr:Rne/Rng family ribonuclease [Bifidobacterium tsurumiense]MSS12442.1 Rne/Rng family ribonuclease [Bifidobacterium tsurumiense]